MAKAANRIAKKNTIDMNLLPPKRLCQRTLTSKNASSMKGTVARVMATPTHVLASAHWRLLSSERGPDLGSDHLPVLARVELIDGACR